MLPMDLMPWAFRRPFLDAGKCEWCGEEIKPVPKWRAAVMRRRGLLRLCDACGEE